MGARKKVKTPINLSLCVKRATAAGNITQPTITVSFWRVASAYAHGRHWATRYTATTIIDPEGHPGLKPNYQLLAVHLTMVLNTIAFAIHMVHVRSGRRSQYRSQGKLCLEPSNG